MPVENVSTDDRALRLLVDESFERAKQKTPWSIERRRISDRVFFSIAQTHNALEELIRHGTHPWLAQSISVPVNVIEDRGRQNVDVPYTPALGLAVASKMALDWQSWSPKQEMTELVKTLQELLAEVGPGKSFEQIIKSAPHWGPLFDVLISDIQRGSENISLLQEGLDVDELISEPSDFLVDRKKDPLEQIHAIAAGIFNRLGRLHSQEHQQVLEEMRRWERWTPQIVDAIPEYLPMLHDIYEKVQINPKLLRNAVSPVPGLKSSAIEEIESKGGFLHPVEDESLRDMITKGVTAVIPNVAYYSVMNHPSDVVRLLGDDCGFDPGSNYVSTEDLPTQSKKGWPLNWWNKPYALAMFQNPEQVAFSVEVAVKKASDDVGASGKNRRDTGVASALKHSVYSRIKQPLVLTRHFEILEVNGVSLPSAVNYGSAYFIEALGGRHIGAAEEKFIVNPQDPTPVSVKVLWHYCLADRLTSLKRIEQKRQK